MKSPVKGLVLVLLVVVVLFSSSSMLVQEALTDTYNQIPLWINVMEGAPATGEEIHNLEKRIDEIFKQNGLNWRVTSVILDANYPDPDKTNDDPGDVREGPEEDGLYKKGKDETKNLGGFKVFVVNRILNGTGHDVGYLGGAKQSSHTAVVASNYTDVDEGTIWAHEIGHLLGLDHENPDGSDRPAGDLLNPFWPDMAGANLTDADKATMNATKIEQDLGLPTLTPDQQGRNYNMYHYILEDLYGDSLYEFTDLQELYFGFYMLDSTENLYVTTFLGGEIPPSAGLTYSLAFDTDGDPTTGGTFAGWLGIDHLAIAHVIPAAPPEGALYSYPDMTPIGPLETKVTTQYQFICPRDPPKIPPRPDSDTIAIRFGLSELGPLGVFIKCGAVIESSDGLGTDRLEIMTLNTQPPDRPELTLDTFAGNSGSGVTATGSGFTPGSRVSIVFAHNNLSTTDVEPDGTFEATFIVPELPPNYYVVDAIDQANKVGVCMFTVSSEATVGYECSNQAETSPEPFNLRGNGTFIFWIEPSGDYTPYDIDTSTLVLNGEVMGVEPSPFEIGDYNGNGILDLLAAFNRTKVANSILSHGTTLGNVDLTLTGRFLDGKYFEGTNVVKVSDLYGDINCDGAVELWDLFMMAKAYESDMEDPRWNDNANFEAPWDMIGSSDLAMIGQHYSEHYT